MKNLTKIRIFITLIITVLFLIIPGSAIAQYPVRKTCIFPWRARMEQRMRQLEQRLQQPRQAQPPQIIYIQPKQQLPIRGVPKQRLPIEGQPKQSLPIEGKPKQPLPIPGGPKQQLPPSGQPKQQLEVPQNGPLAGPQFLPITGPQRYSTIRYAIYRARR